MPVSCSLRTVAALGAVMFLCGCPNPNSYMTPRTLDPGKIEWQVAPEFIGVSYNQQVANTASANVTAFAPMVPSFGARFGVVDGFDMGVHLTNFDSISVDGKIRLVKGQFDLALDPGLQGYYVSVGNTSLGVVYFHVPVLLGFNLSDRLSLVASPGFVYSLTTASVNDGSGVNGAASASGVMGRLGFGVDIRISKRFAIHPELTVMKQFSDLNALFFIGGIGFNFGALPDYSDLGNTLD